MFTKIFSKPMFRLSVVILVNENLLRVTPVLGKEINQKSYARWSARKPSKVFQPEDLSSGSFDTKEFYKSEYSDDKDSDKVSAQHIKASDEKKQRANKKIRTSAEGYDYEVLDEHDFRFSKMMTQVGNRKMRKKHDIILLEGKRLNIDALQAGLRPKKIFFTQTSLLSELTIPLDSKIPLYKLPYRTTKLWSHLDTPPGIIGFYGIPKESDIKTNNTIPVKVLCDNVRDPGNMGSIIRVAACVGCTEILLMKGCTDPWDSKVLRSASGGHFHIPIKMELSWNEHDFFRPSDVVFLADSKEDRTLLHSTTLERHLYHDVNYASTEGSVVVVIGGETEGLSKDAFRLAAEHNGSRVYIPLSNCMESLNSGCALSVLLFEIKRQLTLSDSGNSINNVKSLYEAC